LLLSSQSAAKGLKGFPASSDELRAASVEAWASFLHPLLPADMQGAVEGHCGAPSIPFFEVGIFLFLREPKFHLQPSDTTGAMNAFISHACIIRSSAQLLESRG
jgi:hypothetical protein